MLDLLSLRTRFGLVNSNARCIKTYINIYALLRVRHFNSEEWSMFKRTGLECVCVCSHFGSFIGGSHSLKIKRFSVLDQTLFVVMIVTVVCIVIVRCVIHLSWISDTC